MTILRPLSPSDGREIYDFIQQFAADENGFTNPAKGMPYEDFPGWLARLHGYSQGLDLPDWMVPETHYWMMLDGLPVGWGRLRHHLNDALAATGGHIGYAILPSHRGRGLGNQMLTLLLLECKKMQIPIVQVGANKDNLPSGRIIQSHGGVLHHETATKNLYHISLSTKEAAS